MRDVTEILHAAERGDAKAAGQLLPLVYAELRRLASHRMAQEAPGHTLQPTGLVHEAWLRLVGDEAPMFENRAHFFGAAAEAMRRILVESARRKKRDSSTWQSRTLWTWKTPHPCWWTLVEEALK